MAAGALANLLGHLDMAHLVEAEEYGSWRVRRISSGVPCGKLEEAEVSCWTAELETACILSHRSVMMFTGPFAVFLLQRPAAVTPSRQKEQDAAEQPPRVPQHQMPVCRRRTHRLGRVHETDRHQGAYGQVRPAV